ncbi:MAG: ion transporter [Alcanivoracaceae bacterium]|nr:ion transporter [Alcanivoracaceae bacterium]
MFSISSLVNDPTTTHGRAFALAIQVLILLSLVTFTLDTLPGLDAATKLSLRIIECVTVGIFTVEYLLRIYVAKSKVRFVFSFYGLVDLLAILPFYISSGIDLRAVRVFRFLRLLRILKLVRYNAAIRRFHRAFVIAREELALFGMVALIILYLSSVGIYYFENEAQPEQFKSILHSLWWAVTTLTTVGYGDMYPITGGGKFFTFLVLIVGLGVVAVPTGLIASALTQARDEERAVKASASEGSAHEL